MKAILKGMALSGIAAVTAVGFGGIVAAAEMKMQQATMQEMNGSGASGTSWIELNGDGTATFSVNMTGVTAGMPHAQHVHFGDTTKSDNGPVVPPQEAADDFQENTTTAIEAGGKTGVSDADAQDVPEEARIDYDKFINTLEGQPFYGSVQISLTTEGDYSPKSGLATDRFPTGDENGAYNYERTVDVTDKQVKQIKAGDVEIVVHGGDFWSGAAADGSTNGDPNGTDNSILSYTYNSNADGDANAVAAADVYPKSPLATALGAGPLPLEATMPVATGEFSALPSGSVDTGLGAETTQMSQALILGGATVALAGAAGGALYIRRRGEV